MRKKIHRYYFHMICKFLPLIFQRGNKPPFKTLPVPKITTPLPRSTRIKMFSPLSKECWQKHIFYTGRLMQCCPLYIRNFHVIDMYYRTLLSLFRFPIFNMLSIELVIVLIVTFFFQIMFIR